MNEGAGHSCTEDCFKRDEKRVDERQAEVQIGDGAVQPDRPHQARDRIERRFRNITISNVIFDYSSGLALESVDGGVLEDVTINNVVMQDIADSPIFIRLGARLRGPKGSVPAAIRRVSISNVAVYNADSRYASIISGIPGHYIEGLTLNNIRIHYRGGGTAEQAKVVVPEKEKSYAEPEMFGPIPASAFYIRHVKNLKMSDIEIRFLHPDARSPLVLDDVQGVYLHRVNLPKHLRINPYILKRTSGFRNVPESKPR